MAVAWPVELQEILNSADFGYSFGDTTITSQVETGPVKKRRRTTKPVDSITCSIDMPYEDFQLFWNFFNITLNGGVTQFTFDHPFTGVPTDFRFAGPPSMRPLGSGGIHYRVSMAWEVM